MPTTLPLATYRKGRVVPWVGHGLLAVFLVSLAAFCALLVIKGPAMRAAAEAEEARVIAEENTAFCNKFGMGPATGRYAECAAGLAEIRDRYLQRSVNDLIF